MKDFYRYGYKTNEEIYNALEKIKNIEEYDKKIEIICTLIEKYPNNPECYLARGREYESLREYNNTISDITHAIQLYNKTAVSYEIRGEVYMSSCLFYDAIDDFTTVIERKELEHRDYFLTFCYAHRVMCYCALGNWKEAKKDIGFVKDDFIIYTDPFKGRITKERLIDCIEKQIILK